MKWAESGGALLFMMVADAGDPVDDRIPSIGAPVVPLIMQTTIFPLPVERTPALVRRFTPPPLERPGMRVQASALHLLAFRPINWVRRRGRFHGRKQGAAERVLPPR